MDGITRFNHYCNFSCEGNLEHGAVVRFMR